MKSEKREKFIDQVHFCNHCYYEAISEILVILTVSFYFHIWTSGSVRNLLPLLLGLSDFHKNMIFSIKYHIKFDGKMISLSQRESEVA